MKKEKGVAISIARTRLERRNLGESEVRIGGKKRASSLMKKYRSHAEASGVGWLP